VKRSIDNGEKRFNQLSIEERGKFDEETLVNVNSIKRNKGGSQRSSGFSNEYIVVCSRWHQACKIVTYVHANAMNIFLLIESRCRL
jgi:uncharacterized membrane protein